jgi:hypothetical protein
VVADNNPQNKDESAVEELEFVSAVQFVDSLEDEARLELEHVLKFRNYSPDWNLEVEFDSEDAISVGLVKALLNRNATVDVSLKFGSGCNDILLGVRALLDSGAAGNLISRDFVVEGNIPTRKKEKPVQVVLANKDTSVRLDYETVELEVVVGDHVEIMSFEVMPSLSFPLILGLPWLLRHNPRIDWRLGKLIFENCRCSNVEGNSVSMMSCASVIKFGEILDDSDIFDSVEPVVCDVVLPVDYAQFEDVFSATKTDILPEHRLYDCEIQLKQPDSVPPYSPIYSLPEQDRLDLKKYIDEMLDKGFIRKSNSPAGAGVFFVPKKDKSKRLCVDYRGLNELTVRNSFPMPLISELLDRVRRAKIFTKIDLRGAYNLVRIKPGDEWKTAFRCQYGHFEYLVMPFGLTNAPAIFQGMMVDIFRDILDIYVVIYLDDLLIFSVDEATHVGHVQEVLSRLRKFRLYAKASKCVFHSESVEFLGFVVSASGLCMAEDKLAAVKEWPVPSRVKDVQSFLGFCNFYRRFIKSFSEISRCLSDLTKKDVVWCWSDDCQLAFESLKDAILSAPSLHHPDFLLPFVLETDASDFAVGAVLSQPFSAEFLSPVGFFSRKLSSAEVNYDVHDKELLAIVCALDHWSHYLLGSPHVIKVFTDHRNLVYFRTRRTLSPRLLRWSAFLNQFDFVISYRKGELNIGADSLSRRSDFISEGGSRSTNVVEECLLPDKFWNLNVIEVDTINSKKAHLAKQIDDKEEQFAIIKSRHELPLAGHPGRLRTFELVARDFIWPGMRQMIYNYVDACSICQKAKYSRKKPSGLLNPLPISSRPWKDISMDFIVKLPVSNGFDSILVVVDRFSKMSHFIPVSEKISSVELVEVVFNYIFKLHGIPDTIVSDRGPQFISNFWKELWSFVGSKACLSTAAHPESDGQTERTNQSLEQYLRCYVSYLQNDWSNYLPFAEFALNNSISSSTGKTPFFANYGFNPRMDSFDSGHIKTQRLEQWIDELKVIHLGVEFALKEASNKIKFYADKKRSHMHFEVGEYVWLSTENLNTSRPCKKLEFKRIGPFKIIQKLSEVSFKLELPSSMRIHPVFHVSLLTKFRSNDAEFQNVLPDPIIIEGNEEFEVEEILGSRLRDSVTEFLVKWKGYDSSENTWEPIHNVVHCWGLVRIFYRRFKDQVHRPSVKELKAIGKFLP